MKNFKYKEYTVEERTICYEAIAKVRECLKNGLNFNEVCMSVSVDDAELKRFIVDGALKIMIAEMHYAGGMELTQVAGELKKVPVSKIKSANMEMIEDVKISAAKTYKQSTQGGPAGSA